MASMAQSWHPSATRCYRKTEFHDTQQILCVIKFLSFATFTDPSRPRVGERSRPRQHLSTAARVGSMGRARPIRPTGVTFTGIPRFASELI